jgi:hypothetical protein
MPKLMDTFAEKRKLTMNYKVKVFTCLVMFTGMLSMACDRGQLLPAEPVFVRTELLNLIMEGILLLIPAE